MGVDIIPGDGDDTRAPSPTSVVEVIDARVRGPNDHSHYI
jgi:hypothetical protein